MEKILFVVADYANMTSNNKINIMGIFTEINPNAYPYNHQNIFLVMKLKAAPEDIGKSKNLVISFFDTDKQEKLTIPQEITVPEMKKGRLPEFAGVVSINNLTFEKPGYYSFALSIDDNNLGNIGFYVNTLPENRG